VINIRIKVLLFFLYQIYSCECLSLLKEVMADYLLFRINNYVGHGRPTWNQPNKCSLFPSLCTKGIFCGGRAHYLFFDSAPQHPGQTKAKKYPSIIIVRQTEITLRALFGERGESPSLFFFAPPSLFIFIFFFLPFTEVCVNIH
jgi:hypothetical protein